MIGNILLTLALAASVFSLIMYYLTYKGYSNTLKLARIGYHTTAISIIAASALLLNAILTHQYQYRYVYNYSNDDLPLGLLMSTFYAGQEGSFMLWLLFTAIVGLILMEYTSKRKDLEQYVMMIFSLAVAFLLVMVSPGLKSPFAYIWSDPQFIEISKINSSFLSLPFLQNFMHSDPSSNQTFVQINSSLAGALSSNGISINDFIANGKGLNPLLQNFWMQIHPPMLFIGFAMSTVPFAFALAALMKNEYKDWVKQAMPWVLSGMMILGLAIMLGGYWAYGVLGWGGYWGWDPVENSSLVPWIIGVASIHTMLVQLKTRSNENPGRFVKTNLILCILTYVLVLYSTFLTRSGILGDASVHSFVDPGMTVYLLLVLFIGTFIVVGFGSVAYRWKYLEKTFGGEDNVLSRELALFTGSVALIASAIIILAGTSAPIFGRSVELSFYNELNLPLGIIIGLLNGLSLLLRWKTSDGKNLIKDSQNTLIATVVLSGLIIVLGGISNIMLALLTISSVFALLVNARIAFRILKGKRSHLGAYVAHTGISLFLLGVIATGGFSKQEQVELVKNEPKNVLGYDLTFTGYTPIDGGKRYAFNIEVKKENSTVVISPVMFIAEFNNSLMREPDILNKWTKDFYVSPISYQDSRDSHSPENEIVLTKGQTHEYKGAVITFDSFNFPPDAMSAMQSGEDFYIGAKLNVQYDGKIYNVEPKMVSRQGQRSFESVEVGAANLKIEMTSLQASGSINLIFSSLDGSSKSNMPASKESLSIDASIKPFINLVWAGVVVMVAGFFIAIVRRTKDSQV